MHMQVRVYACMCVCMCWGDAVGIYHTLNDTIKFLESREPKQDKLSLNSEPPLPIGKQYTLNLMTSLL